MKQHRVCEACGDPLPTNKSSRKYCDKCRGKVNTVRNRNTSRIRSGCSTISCTFCGCDILATSKTMLCRKCEMLRDSREAHNDSIDEGLKKKKTPSLPVLTKEEIRRNRERLIQRHERRKPISSSFDDSPTIETPSNKGDKHKPVAPETAPITFHDRTDPETGTQYIVECRGSGFYCGRKR